MQDNSFESEQDSFASDSEDDESSRSDQEDQEGSHSDGASCVGDEGVFEAPKGLDKVDVKLGLTNQRVFDGGDIAFREVEDLLQVPREASCSGEEEGLPEAPEELKNVDAELDMPAAPIEGAQKVELPAHGAPSFGEEAIPEAPRELDKADANLELANQSVHDGVITGEEEDMPEAPSEAQPNATLHEVELPAYGALASGDEAIPEAPRELDEADANLELANQSVHDGVINGEEEDMPVAPLEAQPEVHELGAENVGLPSCRAPSSGDKTIPEAPNEPDEAKTTLGSASQCVRDGVTTGKEEDVPEAPSVAHHAATLQAPSGDEAVPAVHREADEADANLELASQCGLDGFITGHSAAANGEEEDVSEALRKAHSEAHIMAEEKAAEQAADLADSEDEIWTDEGRAFALALKEAQAALDAARQFVVSPWDRKSVGAPPPPPARNIEDWEEPQALEASAATAAMAAAVATPSPNAIDVPETGVSTSKDPPDAGSDPVAETKLLAEPVASAAALSPRCVPRRHREPSPSGISRRHGARSPGSARSSHKPAHDVSPRVPEPPQPVADLNELHVRFGENAARARVERAHSMDRAEKLRKQAEAEAKAAMAAQKGTVVETSRQQAGRRAASERRLKQVAEQKECEDRLLALARRESDARAGKRYAASAARRAHSEKSRQDVMLREVLSDLGTVQSQRREAAEHSGRELQRRCKEADWSHAKPAILTGRQRQAHPPAPLPAQPPAPPGSRQSGKGRSNAIGAASARSSTSLPLLPKMLPPGAQVPAAAPSAGGDLRLPPLLPSGKVH